jgi:hypothetical protein
MLSVKKSCSNARDLINANFYDCSKILFVTLTYAENMTDTKRLYHDLDVFVKRFKRHYPSCDAYFIAVEPQGRGAWHCHIIFRFIDDVPFINDLSILWTHGFVYISKRLTDINNLGVYLSSYLCDVEFNDDNCREIALNGGYYDTKDVFEKEFVDIDGSTKKKKFIKGGRLWMYPPKMNIFRHSKNLIKPKSELLTYNNALKKVGSALPTFRSCNLITSTDFSNLVIYEQYNTKINNSQ